MVRDEQDKQESRLKRSMREKNKHGKTCKDLSCNQ